VAKLQRENVIRAALALLDEVGAEGLTTRKLAERLHVQQPALYWHFKNKRELLDALAEAMLAENHLHSLPRAGEDWRSFLAANARSFRRALLARRDGARIHAGTRPGGEPSAAARAQVRLLCEAGFTSRDAVLALAAISHYTVGAALEQQMAEEAGRPADGGLLRDYDQAGPDAAFEFGIETLIAGLERRVSRAAADSRSASSGSAPTAGRSPPRTRPR